MSGFEDREKGFEAKFSIDQKASFDVEARCSKLFGLWAAERMGLDKAQAAAYAADVVAVNLDEPGFDDVIRKVKGDFSSKNIKIDDHTIEVALEKSLQEAKRQIQG